MKDIVENKINNWFKCKSKIRVIDNNSFELIIKSVIECSYTLEIMQDAKLNLTESEMYAMIGKALMESIKSQELTN